MSAVVPTASDASSSLPVSWQLHYLQHRNEPVLSFNIDAFRFRVGRRDGLNLTLPSHQVSGLHAEFVLVGIRLFIRDMGSTNGTYVNGKRIDHRDFALRCGDRVRMANVEFVVRRRQTEAVASGDSTELPSQAVVPPPTVSSRQGRPRWMTDSRHGQPSTRFEG